MFIGQDARTSSCRDAACRVDPGKKGARNKVTINRLMRGSYAALGLLGGTFTHAADGYAALAWA